MSDRLRQLDARIQRANDLKIVYQSAGDTRSVEIQDRVIDGLLDMRLAETGAK